MTAILLALLAAVLLTKYWREMAALLVITATAFTILGIMYVVTLARAATG